MTNSLNKFTLTIAMIVPAVSLAQAVTGGSVDDCLKFEKPDARLACYDMKTGFQPKEQPKADERPAVRWKVRDSGTVSPIGFADVGTKPGLFQVGRTDGTDFTSAKVAIVGVGRAINQPDGFFDGWEPFVGVSWDRDTSAKKPKDLRQAVVGISGQIGTPGPTDVSAFPTFRIGYKKDVKADKNRGFLNAHLDVIYIPWVNSPEGLGKNSSAFVPYIGLYSEATRTNPSTSNDGTYLGAYLGAKWEVKLGAIAERLTLTAQGQVYRDGNTPISEINRTLRFGTIGLKYDLVDPKAKQGWVPSLSLSWQRGTEPVTGEGPTRKTVLGFGVKFD